MQRMARECPLPVYLERDPDNPHDENAIKVYLNAEPWVDFHIGFVARQTASVIAPKMDDGTFNPESAWLMYVHPGKTEAGVIVKLPAKKP